VGVPPEHAVCVLLAAGRSSRYPGDKLLAELNGRPLLEHAAAMLAAIPFKAHVAVVPPDAPGRWERLAALGFAITVNLTPEAGQGASLRAGAAAAAAHLPAAILLALADMPFVPESHISRLLSRLDPADPKSIAFSLSGAQQGGWRGPPAAFGGGWLPELARADGDKGARPILAAAPGSAGIPVPAEWLEDFDTPADFARAGGGFTLP
jgi:molybdenum cofactor cytidylyltransferase